MSKNDCFIKACRGEATDRIPAWFMRQAGRYMPEYRAIRDKHSFLEMVKNPEVAAEITLQPIKAFDIDAGIIFADILPLLEAMGMDLEFIKGTGPVLHNPLRSPEQIAALTPHQTRSEGTQWRPSPSWIFRCALYAGLLRHRRRRFTGLRRLQSLHEIRNGGFPPTHAEAF
jgi:uroporphyrinogen-III decarboxylase